MKYKLKFIALLSISLFCQSQAQSQKPSPPKSKKVQHYVPATGIRGAVLGSLIYPGFKIGVERPYKYTQLDIIGKQSTNTVYKERYLSYSLSMYHQVNYHTNFFAQVERIKRRQMSIGLYVESSFGLGVSRTFVDGAAYTVSADGAVEKARLSGNWYGLASMGWAVGYNANLNMKQPYSVYAKSHWLLFFPYNALATPRPTVELGLNYNLSGFWKAKPKLKSKQRSSLISLLL